MAKNKEEEQNEELNYALSNISNKVNVNHLLESGAIPPGIDTEEKLMTIVQMGKELGLQPITSVSNLHVIKGRVVISSHMIGAMLKRNNIEYRYIRDWHQDDDGRITTALEFEWISPVTNKPKTQEFEVSWKEMEVAGYTTKDNWKKYPKNMLRARCMAYGARALFPEIFLGLYSDMEIVDAMDDENHVVSSNEEGDIVVLTKEQAADGSSEFANVEEEVNE